MAEKQRIILVNASRLLREMLHVIINRSDRLQIVWEAEAWEELPAAIEQLELAWLVISLSSGGRISNRVDRFLSNHPATRLLAFSPDSHTIKIKWAGEWAEELVDPPLTDLLRILEGQRVSPALPTPGLQLARGA